MWKLEGRGTCWDDCSQSLSRETYGGWCEGWWGLLWRGEWPLCFEFKSHLWFSCRSRRLSISSLIIIIKTQDLLWVLQKGFVFVFCFLRIRGELLIRSVTCSKLEYSNYCTCSRKASGVWTADPEPWSVQSGSCVQWRHSAWHTFVSLPRFSLRQYLCLTFWILISVSESLWTWILQ